MMATILTVVATVLVAGFMMRVLGPSADRTDTDNAGHGGGGNYGHGGGDCGDDGGGGGD